MSKTSQNGTVDVLSGLRLPPIHEWVTCELDDVNEAFIEQPLKIRVLINPTKGEVLALEQAIGALVKADDASDGDLFDLIAPRVIAWNVVALNDAGEQVPLPPPGGTDGVGGQVFEVLPPKAQTWMLRIARNAHLGGETRSKLSTRPVATDGGKAEKTPSGPRVVSTPSGETHPDPPTSS